MARQDKTARLIQQAHEILAKYHPMTVRQVFYQLVSRHVIQNTDSQYKKVSRVLVGARRDGSIPWGWIEDRLRKPRVAASWPDLPAFVKDVISAYRRDPWEGQTQYCEFWVEKDALSGILEDALQPYGILLNVGRGFDGWSSIHRAAVRYERARKRFGNRTTVLYFGDFDPSGESIVESLGKRLRECGAWVDVRKCALTLSQIQEYKLPPMPTKKSDSRAAKFIAKNGDVSVELDALPPEVLVNMIVENVEGIMDLSALDETKRQEELDRTRLRETLAG